MLGQRCWAQGEHQRGQFLLDVLDIGIGFLQAGLRAAEIEAQQSFGGIHEHRDRKDLLLDTIVKVARQTMALLQRGELLLRRQEILELLGQKIEAARQLPQFIPGCVA